MANTCYINSIIQVLVHIYPFVNELILVNDKRTNNQFLVSFKNVLRELSNPVDINYEELDNLVNKNCVEPLPFLSNFGKINSLSIAEDAYETLLALFEELSSLVPNIINDIFLIKCVHNTKKIGSNYTLKEEMNFNILEIIAATNSSLEEQISLLRQPEIFQNEENISYSKEVIFTNLPLILIISIGRYKNENGILMKNSCLFPINNSISLCCFNDDVEHLIDYELFAVIVHLGDGLDSGHYISFIASFNEDDDKHAVWHEFNDKEVYHVSEERVIEYAYFMGSLAFYISKSNKNLISKFNAYYFGSFIKNYSK